jgi:hypothetical protein
MGSPVELSQHYNVRLATEDIENPEKGQEIEVRDQKSAVGTSLSNDPPALIAFSVTSVATLAL